MANIQNINQNSLQPSAAAGASSVSSKGSFLKSIRKIWNESVETRLKNMKFKGTVGALSFVGGVIVTGSAIYMYVQNRNKKREKTHETTCSIVEHRAHTSDDINKNHEASKDNMNENDNRTDNSIREIKAKAECDLMVYGGKKELDLEYKKKAKEAGLLDSVCIPNVAGTPALVSFEEEFRRSHRFPEVPDILKPIFAGVPEGFEIGMLLEMMSTFGALCFSHVRAKYVDGKETAPNIHVMVIGEAGSGKSKFEDIFNCLFENVLAEEEVKCQVKDGSKKIIQIIGPDISTRMFIELLQTNHKTHLFIFSPEVSVVGKHLRKSDGGGGLSYEDLRMSIDNARVSHWTKDESIRGQYPVYLNTMLTGTPNEVKKFFGKEVENGTAQRYCFTCIPPSGNELPMLILPEGEDLEYIKTKISEWRQQFCFTVGACSGDETACEETVVDLSYLHAPLSRWLVEQRSKAEKDPDDYLKKMRDCIRARRGFIAFHCGIVLHMLWGQPEDDETRQKVVDACLYIADYITEGYLYNISVMERGIYRNTPSSNAGRSTRRQFSEEEIAEMVELHSQLDERGQHKYGWDTLARMYGTSFATVRRKVKEYEENHGGNNN